MITELTPEQEQMLVEYRDSWIALGRSTEPVDRAELEAAYRDCYEMAKEPYTGTIWTQSPWAGGCVYHVLVKDGPDEAQRVAALLSKSRLDSEQAEEDAGLTYGDPLTALQQCRLGVFECYWPAFYDFGRKIGAVYSPEADAGLDILLRTRRGHIWWDTPRWVVGVERPDVLRVDDQGRYHCETGPALRYRDGFALYYVEGIKIPRFAIETPEKIQITHIRHEVNVAVRRILMNRYGLQRYLTDTDAELLDRRPNEALLHDRVENVNWLLCKDGSTDSVHPVFVPNTVRTCADAQLFLAGVPENQFRERS